MAVDLETDLVHGVLDRAARLRPNHPWVTFTDGSTHQLSELADTSARVAGALQRHGVAKGDRVAVMIGNRFEFLQVWFASHRIGAIVVPLNVSLRGSVLAHMLNLAEPKVLVCESDRVSTVVDAIGIPGYLQSIVVVKEPGSGEETSSSVGADTEPFDSLLGEGQAAPVEVLPTDASAIMYTSGTTGPSKGVVWTHRFTVSMSQVTADAMEYGADDILYTCLPLFHANALTVATIPSLVAGGRIVVSPRFSASHFWKDIVDHRITAVNLLGAMTPLLLRQDPTPLERQHVLRTALVIPAPPEYYAEIEDRYGFTPVQAYGSTDFGMVLWAPQDRSGPAGSCGKAVPGFDVRVFDELDREVAPGAPGEVVVRPLESWISPLGYWRMPEATVSANRNFWFHTGDMMTRDSQGWFYFRDRVKDAIRRRGENISSFEVEQAFMRHESVAECAAFAVPSELLEDEVAIAVVCAPGTEVDPLELLRFVEPQLPYFAVPRYIKFVAALPKTQTEKVMKKALRDQGISTDIWDRESVGYVVKR